MRSKKSPVIVFDSLKFDRLLDYVPADAFKITMEMARRFNGQNNGEIAFSIEDARHILAAGDPKGCGKNRAKRALQNLVDAGLIIRTRSHGRNFETGHRYCRRWQLTYVYQKKDDGS